jgi:DNA-binding MarR family transcriptional regulator
LADEQSNANGTAITLFERDLEDARRILGAIVRAADRRSILHGARKREPRSNDSIDEDPREELAFQAFTLREARHRHLPNVGEPGWDILIALYLTETSGARHATGRVIELSRSSLTTGLRHIYLLERGGLVVREKDEKDKRIAYVRLSHKGRKRVETILADALQR